MTMGRGVRAHTRITAFVEACDVPFLDGTFNIVAEGVV